MSNYFKTHLKKMLMRRIIILFIIVIFFSLLGNALKDNFKASFKMPEYKTLADIKNAKDKNIKYFKLSLDKLTRTKADITAKDSNGNDDLINITAVAQIEGTKLVILLPAKMLNKFNNSGELVNYSEICSVFLGDVFLPDPVKNLISAEGGSEKDFYNISVIQSASSRIYIIVFFILFNLIAVIGLILLIPNLIYITNIKKAAVFRKISCEKLPDIEKELADNLLSAAIEKNSKQVLLTENYTIVFRRYSASIAQNSEIEAVNMIRKTFGKVIWYKFYLFMKNKKTINYNITLNSDATEIYDLYAKNYPNIVQSIDLDFKKEWLKK